MNKSNSWIVDMLLNKNVGTIQNPNDSNKNAFRYSSKAPDGKHSDVLFKSSTAAIYSTDEALEDSINFNSGNFNNNKLQDLEAQIDQRLQENGNFRLRIVANQFSIDQI